mgnify:CR=1 FL=1
MNSDMFLNIENVLFTAAMVLYLAWAMYAYKQDQEAQKMRDELQVGDEITTIGGIIGNPTVEQISPLLITGRFAFWNCYIVVEMLATVAGISCHAVIFHSQPSSFL